MTRKRILAMVGNKTCVAKFIEAAEQPKSVFSRSFKVHKNQEDQYSKEGQKQNHSAHDAFHIDGYEKHNKLQFVSYISNMLMLENKHFIDSSFLLYVDPVIEDKVNADMRDFTVKNLQTMNKVFFELPIETFVKAVTLVDRFITRVKVKPKYMECVATACFYLSAKTAEPARSHCPSLETLSQLSKCGGTVQDLQRMVTIVIDKLDCHFDFVTSYDFLEFFHKVRVSDRLSNWRNLEVFLELAQTSLKVCYQKPSVVALACLLVNPTENDRTFVKAMTVACKINLKIVKTTAEIITNIYRLHFIRQPCSRSSLVWAISKRTLTNIYGVSPTTLATIFEDINGCSCDGEQCNEDWNSSTDSLLEKL